MHGTESRCVIEQEIILFAGRVSASFSPEILQAGAVKGLEASHSFRVTCDKNAREPAQQPRIALYKKQPRK